MATAPGAGAAPLLRRTARPGEQEAYERTRYSSNSPENTGCHS
jgi:hypothetical protein